MRGVIERDYNKCKSSYLNSHFQCHSQYLNIMGVTKKIGSVAIIFKRFVEIFMVLFHNTFTNSKHYIALKAQCEIYGTKIFIMKYRSYSKEEVLF